MPHGRTCAAIRSSWIQPLVARKTGKRNVFEPKRCRAMVDGAEIVAPLADRKFHGLGIVGGRDWRHEPPIAQHELLHGPREALSGKFVFHGADNGFACFGGVARGCEDVWGEGDVQVRERPAQRNAIA